VADYIALNRRAQRLDRPFGSQAGCLRRANRAHGAGGRAADQARADDVATLGEYFKANIAVLRNCQFINFLDGCGATVPMHDAGQAPAGLMVVGPAMTDRRILAIGLAIETLLRVG